MRGLDRIVLRQVPVQRGRQRGERGRGVADRRRIGRVGIHQHRRLVAAVDRPVEIGRNVHDKKQLAIGEAALGLRLGRERPDVVIAGVAQRRDERPLIFGMVGREQPGRQVLGVGVDRVAEQKQLHHRQGDDHAQRQRVAPDLDPFLAQDGQEASEGEAAHAGVLGRGRLSRWMNTSSSCGATSCQASAAPPSSDLVACSSAARSMPATWIADPNTAAASTPGMSRSLRAATSRSAPVASIGHQSAALRHLVRRALHHDLAIGEIDDAPAALGLVHVMRRDENGETVARHVVDEIPELAARLGVDTRRRLVEQQKLRLVQDAGGEGQPLLPAARQLAGQLVRPVRETHPVDDRLARPRDGCRVRRRRRRNPDSRQP